MSTAAILEHAASPWVHAHEALTRLAKQRAQVDAHEGRCLLAALRAAAHVHLGFATFGEYIERLFGYSRRNTQEKLRVAEALEQLPVLADALDEGDVSWSAVRELTRVASPTTEREWLEVARRKTVRQLEELVAGKLPGDNPASPADPSARRHVLRFEVTPETLALFREATAALCRRAGSPLSEEAVLFEMARQALGGPAEVGQASYQIALTVCAECGRGSQHANGELVAVGPDVIEMAQCDAQQIGCMNPQPVKDAAPSKSNQDSALAPSPPSAHVGARAKQAIPPRVRRTVLARDHHRCRVPGCLNATFVDLHHIRQQSEGGTHAAENLITVCGAHHRALHRGQVVTIGSSANDINFRHSDGAPYGEVREPHVADTMTKVFGALRGLGFREGDVRRVLDDLSRDVAVQRASKEQWLRVALQQLTPSRA